jgi:hypothetical protein
MKTVHFFAAILLICNVIPQETNTISKNTIMVVVPALYVGSKLIQSNVDTAKAQRLTRKDRDAACNYMIRTINKNCDHAICKEMTSILKQIQSTPSQQAHDTIQDALQMARETEAGKEIEKAINEYQKTTENLHEAIIDQIKKNNKPKK